MKKFTKVSLMIAAVLASIGLLLCGIASLMGARYGTVRQMVRNGELNLGSWYAWNDSYDEDWRYYNSGDDEGESAYESTESEAGQTSGTEAFSIESVKNLNLVIDYAELCLEESADTEHITVTLNRGYQNRYECKMDGDTLKVKYDAEKDVFFRNHNRRPKITVSIPKGMVFEKLSVEIGAAEASFEVEDVSCEMLTINVGVGNLQADGFRVLDLMDVTIGTGNVKIEDGVFRDVKLDCGVGNFSMDGIVAGDIDGRCGLGNMELELEGGETDYNYNLSCGLGEIRVNQTRYTNISGGNKVNNNADQTITLDCGLGRIKLEVQE